MQGNYYGNAPYLVSPMAGINKYAKTTYAKGCDINSQDKSGFTAACNVAKAADATVLVMGMDGSQEGEEHDRTSIAFPGVQDDLIQTVSQCSKGPVVLVVMTGGPVDLTAAKNNAKVNSILWVGYPGQSGGDAIAQTLFGDNSPAGRLPYTIYPAGYISVPMTDMSMRPNPTTGNPGRTYRFYTGTSVYSFGAGLSYTTFAYSFSNASPFTIPRSTIEPYLDDPTYTPWKAKSLFSVSITVTNTGTVTSDVIVQAYMIPANPGKDGNPLKFLFGFNRVHSLAPGASQTSVFPVTAHDLSVVDPSGRRVSMVGTWEVAVEDLLLPIKVVDY